MPHAVIDFYLLVLSEFDCFDKRFEREFTNALVLMVVPQQHLIHGELRVRASTHQSQNVAPKEHLHYADSAVKLYTKVNAKLSEEIKANGNS